MQKIVDAFVNLAGLGKAQGLYENVPDTAYNDPKFPGWRSSDLKAIHERSFNHWALKQKKESEELAFGTLFHRLMETGEDRSKFEVSNEDWDRLRHMRDKVIRHPRAKELIEGAKAELTGFAIDPETGLLLRSRMDLYRGDGEISDFKTCRDASPMGFKYAVAKYGYKFSAAHYCLVNSLISRCWMGRFNIIAVESAEPFSVAVYKMSQESLQYGLEGVRGALVKVKRAEEKIWYGYDVEPMEI